MILLERLIKCGYITVLDNLFKEKELEMEKKLRQSKIVIALYVVAALTFIYACYLVGSTLAYVISYYSSYSMSPAFGETFAYVLQAAWQPLLMAALVFSAGYILNEVRALNPNYYATDEEIKAAKEAKKASKKKANAKKEEKTEATEVTKENKPNEKMTKAELLEIANVKGVVIPSKSTKAEIIELLNK